METRQAELQVSLASCSEDLAAAFQAQCDVSFLAALLGQFQLFRASKASEVRLLLKLNNLHEAQLKIVYYGTESLGRHNLDLVNSMKIYKSVR